MAMPGGEQPSEELVAEECNWRSKKDEQQPLRSRAREGRPPRKEVDAKDKEPPNRENEEKPNPLPTSAPLAHSFIVPNAHRERWRPAATDPRIAGDLNGWLLLYTAS
jgi:hypothetical protein